MAGSNKPDSFLEEQRLLIRAYACHHANKQHDRLKLCLGLESTYGHTDRMSLAVYLLLAPNVTARATLRHHEHSEWNLVLARPKYIDPCYHHMVPASPLKGPTTLLVIQPP